MNTYSSQIADELARLKSLGAVIPENAIESAQNGNTGIASFACDRLKGTGIDTAELSRLSNLASREDSPDYWAAVDAGGGWQKSESEEAYQKNLNLLFSLFKPGYGLVESK